MGSKLNILIIAILWCASGFSQISLPLADYYHAEVDRIAVNDTSKNNYFNSHLSLKPILDQRTNTDKIYHSEGKFYYWITQKLFKENFVIFKGEDFWCAVDPIVDLEVGNDFSRDSIERLFWNTRGIRVQGKFFDKVGFTTKFYETQAILPFYQREFADAHGEFFPNSNGTKYIQNNAIIPGYARTKSFKETGYDFAFAEGNFSILANKHLNFQLGNGNHFVGRGYRSLLLSDFSTNYPFFKTEVNFWNNRIQYSAIYAIHQNLYRLLEFTSTEATFERKIGTYHYLDIALSKNIQIGFFEGSHWRRTDSLGTVQPNLLFTNPVIFANTAVNGFESNGFKSILGINASATIGKELLYGQLVFDNAQLGGYQVGLKFYDLFVEKFDGGIEYNHAELDTYLSSERRYNYSHSNLPLAHPLVAGFDEITVNLSFERNRFFVQNRFTYSQRMQNDSIRIGNNIILPSSDIVATDNRISTILYNQFEIGYRFNKNYNLQAFIGHLYRNETLPTNNPLTNYTYIGVRTQLKNKISNF